MISTRRLFSIRALAGLGIFAGVRRAWAQCSYVFFNCYDFCENNCWGCGSTSFSAWQDSIIIPNY